VRKPIFSVAEAARVVGGQLAGADPDAPITGVSVDSRRVSPGDLFVAIRGQRHDGHDFLEDAAQAGAVAALVSKMPDGSPGLALIRVPDSVAAMGTLAAHHRRRFEVTVVGITGSVGKTSVKELTAAVLGERLRVLSTPGNMNTEIGVPLTLFGLNATHEVAVLEMGMRGEGQIAYLAGLAQPRVGVITGVGESHLELLGSLEAVARAKGELLRALPEDGVAVVNADNPWSRRLGEAHPGPVVTYGRAAGATVTVTDYVSRGEAGTSWKLVVRPQGWPGRPLGQARTWPPGPAEQEVRLPLAGRHQADNALAAAAIGLLFGLDLAAVARGLAGAAPAGMRLELRRAGGLLVLDDTYNSSPASALAALETLQELAGAGRALAVLGDMLELGDYTREGHLRVGQACAGLAALITVGRAARDIAEGARRAGLPAERLRCCDDTGEALGAVLDMVREGDIVLFKASRGMRLECLVSAVLEALERRTAS